MILSICACGFPAFLMMYRPEATSYTLKTQTTTLNPEPYILKPEDPDLSQGESQLKSSMLRVSKALSTQREASQASRDVYL